MSVITRWARLRMALDAPAPRDAMKGLRALAEASAPDTRQLNAEELAEAERIGSGFRPGQRWLDRHRTICPEAAALGRQLVRDLRSLDAIDAYFADARAAVSLEMARDRADDARRYAE